MNEHPRELLPLIAEGLVPSPEIAEHLDGCTACRAALDALSPLDLDYVWDGLSSELHAPPAPLVERTLGAIGVDPSLARFAAVTPSLRPAWILSTVGVFAMALILTMSGQNSVSPLLVLAPVAAAALVAFSYGPLVEPAYEIVAATPLSPITALMIRLAGVFAFTSVLVGVGDLAADTSTGAFAWFLPMTAFALASAFIAVRTQPIAGAVAGIAGWCSWVTAAVVLSANPAGLIWGHATQLLYAGATVGFAFGLVGWVRSGTRVPLDIAS